LRRQTSAEDAEPHADQSDESRRQGDDQLSGVVDAVTLCAHLTWIVLPVVAALLVTRAAYSSYYAYVVDDDGSGRLWMDMEDTRTTKTSRHSVDNRSESELRRVVELSSVGDEVFIIVLHLGFSATCCVFDVVLYWLLTVVRRHTAPPPFDFTGAHSVNSVASGEGAIIGVLAEFLTLLHAGHWFGFTDAGYVCSVQPAAPHHTLVIVVVVLYVLLFLFIALRSTVWSWQNHIAAYFYPDHEQRKRRFYSALLTARLDHHRLDDDAPAAAQKDVLRDLMCLGPISWRPDTLLAVRRATIGPASDGPRCVACGQPVSRRLRSARASTKRLSDADCLDDADVCPVCDCRLTSDGDVFCNAACCTPADVSTRLS